MVAVKVDDKPGADLLVCAVRPEGFPQDDASWAVMPVAVREAIIRLARAFASNADQLDRVVDWHLPGTCVR